MRVETLAEQLFFVTVRLECRAGSELSTGTGFIYGVEAEAEDGNDRGTAQFLVTNRHVAEGARDGLLVQMIAKKRGELAPDLGQPARIHVDAAAGWTYHPDPEVDIAVLPFVNVLDALEAADTPAFYKSVPASWTLTAESASSLDALEEVQFVGYPNNLFDDSNLTPIMRRGSTATSMSLDYCGKPCFLIDASVFPGSSGSPVFLRDNGTFRNRDGTVHLGQRLMFLGVLAAVHVRDVRADLIQTAFGVLFQDPLNLGLVFRAEEIDVTIDRVLESSGYRRAEDQSPGQPQGATETDEALGEAA